MRKEGDKEGRKRRNVGDGDKKGGDKEGDERSMRQVEEKVNKEEETRREN